MKLNRRNMLGGILGAPFAAAVAGSGFLGRPPSPPSHPAPVPLSDWGADALWAGGGGNTANQAISAVGQTAQYSGLDYLRERIAERAGLKASDMRELRNHEPFRSSDYHALKSVSESARQWMISERYVRHDLAKRANLLDREIDQLRAKYDPLGLLESAGL